MRKVTPTWFYAALIMTAIASLVSLRYRISIESRNQRVTIAMDYGLIEAATPVGSSTLDSLRAAADSGLNAVTISEITVAEAITQGSLQIRSETGRIVVTGDVVRLRKALDGAGLPTPIESSDGSLTFVGTSVEQVRPVSLGLPTEAVENARDAGLLVIARFANPPMITPTSLRATLADARAAGAWAYLPEGEQVLGQRDLVPTTAEILREQGLLYCAAEFTKISGDAKLSAHLADRLLRLHSIQAAEVDKLAPSEFMERLVKAARERNNRVLLVRPMSNASDTPLGGVTNTLKSLRGNLAKEGIETGEAKPFTEPLIPRALFVFVGFGISMVGLFVVQSVTGDARIQIVCALGLVLVAALSITESFRQIPALLAAIAFPCSAYVWLTQTSTRVSAFVAYATMSVISLLGGLAGAALLNGLNFYVKIDQFSGVKLAHMLPILFVGAFLVTRRFKVRTILASPVRWGGILGLLVAVAVLSVMMMRTGNDNPAGVSGLELKLRSVMDWLFFARPRTKEIFFGHPALVVGLFAFFAARKGAGPRSESEWTAIVLLIVGTIGQTSIVNTFSHLHTPLLLSLARVGIGWAVGGVIGLAIWVAVKPWIVHREAVPAT